MTDQREITSITEPPAHLADWDLEALHQAHDRFDISPNRDRTDIATARRNVQLELQRRSNAGLPV